MLNVNNGTDEGRGSIEERVWAEPWARVGQVQRWAYDERNGFFWRLRREAAGLHAHRVAGGGGDHRDFNCAAGAGRCACGGGTGRKRRIAWRTNGPSGRRCICMRATTRVGVPRMISRNDSSLGWTGPPGYPVLQDGFTQDAYWSDPRDIAWAVCVEHQPGQYPIRYTCTGHQASDRRLFARICSTTSRGTPRGSVRMGWGSNFPSVSPPLGPGSAAALLEHVEDPRAGPAADQASTEMVAVDSHTERFSPGPPVEPFTFYGNPEPLVNYSWVETCRTAFTPGRSGTTAAGPTCCSWTATRIFCGPEAGL